MAKKILLGLVIVGLFIFGRALFFYRGRYTPPHVKEETGVEKVKPLSFEGEGFQDVYRRRRGKVIFDAAHHNDYQPQELHVLLSRLTSRGYGFEYLKSGIDLREKLKYADSLVVIAPDEDFSQEAADAIAAFVERGGRLLLISDPTRSDDVSYINGLASQFGMVFEDDYLYNLKENQGNYSYIILRDFRPSSLTENLQQVVFYAAHSVSHTGEGIILTDENTVSSLREPGGSFPVAVLAGGGKVLGLADLTFMMEPYNAVLDNDQLISNVADFLTTSERQLTLADSPYFFADTLRVVSADPMVFNVQLGGGVELKELFEKTGRKAEFGEEEDVSKDMLFIGLFEDAEKVEKYLESGGISIVVEEVAPRETKEGGEGLEAEPEAEEGAISGWVKIKGIGDLAWNDSSLIYLYEGEARHVLIVLSDSDDTLKAALDKLILGELESCLITDEIAYCQEKEFVRPAVTVRPTPTVQGKILIVSDDDAEPSFDNMTSVKDYRRILGRKYGVSVLEESLSSYRPSLARLRRHDAVVWTTGDFWNKAPDEADAAVLRDYVAGGGNLLLSGGWISFDWQSTSFLAEVCHAKYIGHSEQRDIQVVDTSHPIAKGFEPEEIIDFVTPPSGSSYNPDGIYPVDGAVVAFARGPDSTQSGAASIIAYEDAKLKVAYIAFPLYLLPEEAKSRLVENIFDWFMPPQAEVQPAATPTAVSTPTLTPELTLIPTLTPSSAG